MKRMLPLLWLLLVATALNLFACSTPSAADPWASSIETEKHLIEAIDLMATYEGASVTERAADTAFTDNQLRFATELMKTVYAASEGDNVLLSPLSVQLALAMTANGADGETRAEMERVLGGGIPLDALNEYLHTYVGALPSQKGAMVNIHQAIWFHENLAVKPSFLQANADYYGAAAYRAPFDNRTVDEVNAWVRERTDGMIEQVIDHLDELSRMLLVNTLLFDAEWQTPYEEMQVREGFFTALDGEKQAGTMLHSTEYAYLSLPNATGFLKNYAGGRYAFAALLPNEEVSFDDFLASLTPEGLMSALKAPSNVAVRTVLPQFSLDCGYRLNDVLAALGMPTAFDPMFADFGGMTDQEELYVGSVIHKTHIELSPLGTRAGAATVVEMRANGMPSIPEKEVILDRPFLYLILDTETDLPLFLGTLSELPS